MKHVYSRRSRAKTQCQIHRSIDKEYSMRNWEECFKLLLLCCRNPQTRCNDRLYLNTEKYSLSSAYHSRCRIKYPPSSIEPYCQVILFSGSHTVFQKIDLRGKVWRTPRALFWPHEFKLKFWDLTYGWYIEMEDHSCLSEIQFRSCCWWRDIIRWLFPSLTRCTSPSVVLQNPVWTYYVNK